MNAGQLTVPAVGAVLSMTTVPVLDLLTSPTEFSAHTLMILGLPVKILIFYYQFQHKSFKQFWIKVLFIQLPFQVP